MYFSLQIALFQLIIQNDDSTKKHLLFTDAVINKNDINALRLLKSSDIAQFFIFSIHIPLLINTSLTYVPHMYMSHLLHSSVF